MVDTVPGDTTYAMLEVSKPFSMVVNTAGRHFFNEAKPYGNAARSF